MNKIIKKIESKRNAKLFFFCCLLFFSFFDIECRGVEAGGKIEANEVLAIGTGVITGGNLAKAKETAISHALTKGMESYLLRRLGSRGVANNFTRIIREIIPGAKEEIENFHILTEDRIDNKCKILVKLRVNEKVISEKLREAGVVLIEGLPIKVLFLVSEIREGIASYWWKDLDANATLSPIEIALYNIFQISGFSPIDRISSMPQAEYCKDLMSFDLKETSVLTWGRLFSADVVVYGQCEFVDDKNISLKIKAFDVNQGVQICQDMQVEQIENGVDNRETVIEGLEGLVKHIAARFIPAIIRFAASNREKAQRLEITLEGLSSYKQFRIFRDFLKRDVTGIKLVIQTRIRKDSMSIAVEFQGDRARFLDRVLHNENLPFLLNVYNTEDGNILFKIE